MADACRSHGEMGISRRQGTSTARTATAVTTVAHRRLAAVVTTSSLALRPVTCGPLAAAHEPATTSAAEIPEPAGDVLHEGNGGRFASSCGRRE